MLTTLPFLISVFYFILFYLKIIIFISRYLLEKTRCNVVLNVPSTTCTKYEFIAAYQNFRISILRCYSKLLIRNHWSLQPRPQTPGKFERAIYNLPLVAALIRPGVSKRRSSPGRGEWDTPA